MEKNNVLKAVALFDNIQALEKSVRVLEEYSKSAGNSLNKMQLILKNGDIVEVANFNDELSQQIYAAIISYKKNQLQQFETELKNL